VTDAQLHRKRQGAIFALWAGIFILAAAIVMATEGHAWAALVFGALAGVDFSDAVTRYFAYVDARDAR